MKLKITGMAIFLIALLFFGMVYAENNMIFLETGIKEAPFSFTEKEILINGKPINEIINRL